MRQIVLNVYGQARDGGVVRMPRRSHPSLVLEGITIERLARDAADVLERAKATGDGALLRLADGLAGRLRDLRAGYVAVLRHHDLDVPFAVTPETEAASERLFVGSEVRVAHLLRGYRHVVGGRGVLRDPQVGDVGRVVRVHCRSTFRVRCVDECGRIVWSGPFSVDELEPVERNDPRAEDGLWRAWDAFI